MKLIDRQLPDNCTYYGNLELNVSNILITGSKRTAVTVLSSHLPAQRLSSKAFLSL
jgi:hypothetical protein